MKKIGLFIIVVGITCFILKAIMGSSLADDGTLIEPFFLLPIGYGCLGLGSLLVIIGKKKH